MEANSKKKRQGPRLIAQPRPQTLSTLPDLPHRRAGLPPRFTFKLGDGIGDDLTVIGHLSAGLISELYQVWSASYTCALTCKILLAGFGPHSKEMRGLKREAILLKRLSHPHIVRLYGQGAYEGRDYLVQEYLHGPSLFDLIESSANRQMDVPDAIKAIIHVGAAMGHLHSRGYVHRDIKPANILLRGGIPVLVDFDVAYRLKAGRKPRRSIGTDPYMAPEQCLKEELSPAADIFGLGAVLYEMLTGRWPFEEELMNRTEVNTLEGRFPQIRAKPPAFPSKFNSKISSALEGVVMKCLARDPLQRFQTTRGLVKELACLLEGKHQMWPETLDLRQRMA
jgi:eukaryotic-like serine/threonine-protein kinase